jgi:hypothetical protein
MSENDKTPPPAPHPRRPWSAPTIIEGSLARGVQGPRAPFIDGSGASSHSSPSLDPVHS